LFRTRSFAWSIVLFAVVAAAAEEAAPDAAQTLAFLNRAISWYDRTGTLVDLADQPADIVYINDQRSLARQIVGLAFESSKANAQLLAPAASSANPSDRAQRLQQRAAAAAETLRREQAQLADLQAQLAAASGVDRLRLQAAVAEAQSEVALANARNESIAGIASFMTDPAAGTNDLMSQINTLEQTVSATPSNAIAVSQTASRASASSVFGLFTELLRLNSKDFALQDAIRSADALERQARSFAAPLGAMRTQTRQRADVFLNAAEAKDAAEMMRRKAAIDALTARFRGINGVLMPLTKQRILLEAYKRDLGRWRSAVIEQYREDLRRLAVRGLVLAILILLVVAIAAIWRRLTFRYVQDVKRRHHFMLIRRVVMLFLVAGIILATFASDFGSLTTFVGLITAGIAIALQDVILSIAGYFVIIGKYGVRIGDRVRIAAVNGEVIDIGLVWMYLMELETRGGDQLPTGRIVEFPNSVVFDHSAGVFKQMPGTRYLWHDVAVIVPATSDFGAMQERMIEVVDKIFADYKDSIERQHREMNRLLRTDTQAPRPFARLHVALTGIEIRVRYPVLIDRAGEIDDRVTAAVSAVARVPAV
jgi:small-conductance mechanosensitive channel